ncbi:MAG: RusA family crossover junction endodeoxyribonuclease [Eggerthellaceae bacterium]|nr:RusA family crossover junction endodeoxyribonuclease [Eggerthellaceae bacterium]
MNEHLEQMRAPMLEHLGLIEIETVRTRIPCNAPDLEKVIGAMRPRADGRGGNVRMYVPDRHAKAQKRIHDRYELARGRIRANFNGPVLFALVYHRKATKENRRRHVIEQDTYKPDVDNVAKLVMDALTGVAYRDDKQVVGLVAEAAPRFGEMDWYEIEVTYCEVRR